METSTIQENIWHIQDRYSDGHVNITNSEKIIAYYIDYASAESIVNNHNEFITKLIKESQRL